MSGLLVQARGRGYVIARSDSRSRRRAMQRKTSVKTVQSVGLGFSVGGHAKRTERGPDGTWHITDFEPFYVNVDRHAPYVEFKMQDKSVVEQLKRSLLIAANRSGGNESVLIAGDFVREK